MKILDDGSNFSSAFRQSTEYALKCVVGEGGAKVAFFHLKLEECLDDPEEVDRRFTTMFKLGTPVLERAIVKNLQERIGVVAKQPESFNFLEAVSQLHKRSKGLLSGGSQR